MPSHQKSVTEIATIGFDIGKITVHLIGQDRHGNIVMRAKVSRAQLFQRLANVALCVISMEPGAGAHHIARRLLDVDAGARVGHAAA
jgi:hypothetical protein